MSSGDSFAPYSFGVAGILDEVLCCPDVLQYGVCFRVPQRVEVVLHLHADPVNHLQ